jgi:hypothetical protein
MIYYDFVFAIWDLRFANDVCTYTSFPTYGKQGRHLCFTSATASTHAPSLWGYNVANPRSLDDKLATIR